MMREREKDKEDILVVWRERERERERKRDKEGHTKRETRNEIQRRYISGEIVTD